MMRSLPLITAPRGGGSESGSDLELGQIVGTLQRGKWKILFYTVLCVLLGGYYAFRVATPMYTATTTVALDGRSENVVGDLGVMGDLGGDMFTINTEIEVLRARNLIGQVVDDLGLMEDPVYNFTLREGGGGGLGDLIGSVLALLPLGDAEASGEDAGRPVYSDAAIRDMVITAVRGAISIRNHNFSRAYDISVVATSPERAAEIADRLAEFYVLDQIAVKYQATEKANVWLLSRLAELRADLETAENAVKAFNAQTDLVGPEALEALNRQLKDFRDRRAALAARSDELEARVQALVRAQGSGDARAMADAADDPALAQAVRRLAGGGAAARAVFDQRFEQVLERARFEAARAVSQVAALDKSITDLDRRVAQQSTDLLKLEQLEREAEASRAIYETFQTRQKETSVQEGIHTADSRVLSQAVVPLGPSSPKKGLILVASALIGLFLGAGLVMLRELRQSTYRSAQDLEQATGLTVFAQVPRAPVTKRRRLLRYLETKPTSSLVEAVRNLRTSILLSNVDKPPQVIMMTSSLPGEGKTTQSLALAQSFSGIEKKVLLIEGDIRRRTFQEYFDVKNRAGLVTAVAGDAPLEDLIYSSPEIGVDILLGERSTVNAADFFSSQRFGHFLDELCRTYDIILIDTPPVLVVPDARVIGQMADAVVYIVHWDKTTRAQLDEGLRSLSSIDVKVSGLSLSQIDLKKAQNYGGRYAEVYAAYGSKYYTN